MKERMLRQMETSADQLITDVLSCAWSYLLPLFYYFLNEKCFLLKLGFIF